MKKKALLQPMIDYLEEQINIKEEELKDLLIQLETLKKKRDETI